MKILKATLFLCLIVAFACKKEIKKDNVKADESSIELLSATDLKHKMDGSNLQLIDVRTPSEYELGFIEGAQLITIDDTFIKQSERLNKNEPVYVYCKAGVRSARAAKLLKDNGFTKIYDLVGGISSWENSGFSIKND